MKQANEKPPKKLARLKVLEVLGKTYQKRGAPDDTPGVHRTT